MGRGAFFLGAESGARRVLSGGGADKAGASSRTPEGRRVCEVDAGNRSVVWLAIVVLPSGIACFLDGVVGQAGLRFVRRRSKVDET